MPVYEFRPRPTPSRRRRLSDDVKAWIAFAVGVGMSWLTLFLSDGTAQLPTPLALVLIAAAYWALGKWR